jgi:hypothetical protein
MYSKQKSGWEYKTKYSIETTTAPIIILGNSRCIHDYIPQIISNKLGLDCYNAGRDDQSILYHYAIFKAITKRYTPKIIILDIANDMLTNDTNSYTQLNFLLPYYKKHTELQPILNIKSKFEQLKLLSACYPYNSLFFTMLKGYFKTDSTIDSLKGYSPVYGALGDEFLAKQTNGTYPLDSFKINCLQKIIKDSKQQGIELYINIAPYYFTLINDDASVKIAKQLAFQNKVEMFVYSNNSIFLQQSKLFYNYENLNNTGAEMFSNLLADTILKYRNNY